MSKSDKVKAKKDEVEKRDEDSSEEEEHDAEGQEGSDDEEHEEEGADEGDSDEGDSKDDSEEEESDDEDEPADEEDEEDEEEEEGEEEKAAAKPAGEFAAKYSAKKVRARRPHGDNHDEETPPDPEDEDPFWWGPHAVLGFLIVFGVLGFFGIFNKPLAFLRPANMKADATTETAATPPPQPQTQQPTPPRPPPVPADQPPREMFGAKHLLVMYAGSRRAPAEIKRTKEEAKARATEAMKKAKDGKTKFEDVVKEYTDEPGGGARGGDLGTFPKGSMVPEFQAGLEKIKVGEVSDLVESPFGYHVILRTK